VGEFAKQARTADAGEFKDFTGPKGYTLLLSMIHNGRMRTRDAVATTLVNRAATFHKRAKEELEQRQFDQRQRVEGLLGKFGEGDPHRGDGAERPASASKSAGC